MLNHAMAIKSDIDNEKMCSHLVHERARNSMYKMFNCMGKWWRMAHDHEFKLDLDGQVTCITCGAMDDDMTTPNVMEKI